MSNDPEVFTVSVAKRRYRVHRAWGESNKGSTAVVSEDHAGAAVYEAVVSLQNYAVSAGDLKEIESETGARIEVRRTTVRVSGCSAKAVSDAKERLGSLRDNAAEQRSQNPYTHCVVVPVRAEWLQEKVAELQERILKDIPAGIDVNALVNPEQLGCVVCLLRLQTKTRVILAKSAFREGFRCLSDAPGSKDLVVQLRGLGVEPDGNVRAATSIYVSIEEANDEHAGSLRSILSDVIKSLQGSGVLSDVDLKQQRLMRDGQVRPRLRVDVLNCDNSRTKSINASVVMDRLQLTSLGSTAVQEIRLAKLGDIDESGALRAVETVSLSA